jgi:MoaA/NifB/PqqE/SkfB family radical SAM enzyme
MTPVKPSSFPEGTRSKLMTTVARVGDVSVMNDLSFLWLEITAKCNLYCSHCYAESGPQGELVGNMSYGDWTRVIDEAAELGCRSVQFIGGEPTMHPRLDDLVDHANHRCFEFIEVFTNATRLGKELLGCFRRNGVHVATSFYSDDPIVHEHVTQGKGSWQRTVDGIKTAVAAGLPIRVGVIETEQNQGHGPRAIAYLKTLGVAEVRMDRERGVGRGKRVRLGREGERYEELCGQCWKGKLCVTSSGDVFPCVFSRATRLGEVKSGLLAVLQTAKLTDFRLKVRAMHECRLTCQPGCEPGDCPPASPCQPSQCPPECPCSPSRCGPTDG